MTILQQVVSISCTLLPPSPLIPSFPSLPLLPAPRALVEQKQRRALPAPKIAGYLPMPKVIAAGRDIEQPLQRTNPGISVNAIAPKKRVVTAEIANPLLLIDIRRDPDAWWEEFERIHGRIRTTEEMDAELEAKFPGYMARHGRPGAVRTPYAEADAS